MNVALPFLLLLCATLPLVAQEGGSVAVQFIRQQAVEKGLEPTDVDELRITDRYTSADGTEHIYLVQSLYGTPIYNAQAAVHYREGRVIHHTTHLQKNIRSRGAATVPRLTAEQAMLRLGLPATAKLVEADMVYYPPAGPEGPLRLVWQLVVEDRVMDFLTAHFVATEGGEELGRITLTLSCHFGDERGGHQHAAGEYVPAKTGLRQKTPNDGSLYHVFPFGLDSPLDGPRQLISEPADELASPYGWHDTDGEPGPEFTITRGNNAYAYRDADTSNNVPDPGLVADGGPELDFDFFYAPDERPDTIAQASITQLFYQTNKMHDWTYRHGFDEVAGNFQQNNYDRGGRGRDAIRAEAQDGSGVNNANFSTRQDGRLGRIQMFLWKEGSQLVVNRPLDLAGNRLTGTAAFGAEITEVPVTAELAIGRDSTEQARLGCFPLINPGEVAGKIVLLDRGDCTFQQKAYNAEQAGAVGVIICNPANTILTMAAAGNASALPVTIPAVLLRERDCRPLRQVVAAGGTVEVSLQDNDARPVDGAFDNGIVAHEYAHGVSIRLVGGPSQYTCLRNDEQMGEGWSDFFALASSPLADVRNPTGRERRAIGRYALSGDTDSRGIRSAYYTTDFAINDRTYDYVITTSGEHRLGEFWAATLWDVYWAMVDTYGFDEDLMTGTGGNNAAVRLVIEGMKYTSCEPGMVDGRDGILAADRALYGGANQCLLWEVFQRRGIGPAAVQGSSDARNDNEEAFGLPPACIPTVKLTKTADSTNLSAGSSLTFTLTVRNDTEVAIQDVNLTDRLPAGARLQRVVDGEVSQAGDRLDFRIGELAAGASQSVSYVVTTAADRRSTRLLYSGAETTKAVLFDSVSTTGTEGWVRTDSLPYAGKRAWFVKNVGSEQEQSLQLASPVTVTGPRPALRFFTRYETEPAYDAGVVEISTDGGTQWSNLDRQFLRADYRGLPSGSSQFPLRGTPTFWGDSRGYREVIMDLAPYRAQEVLLRWRFASDDGGAARGWWIDEIELLSELVTYEEPAVLTAADGVTDTARVSEAGVVVNAEDLVSGLFTAPPPISRNVRVYPNPARERVQLRWEAGGGATHLELYTLDGRLVRTLQLTVAAGRGEAELPITGLPMGAYSLRITDARGVHTAKLTVGY